VRTTVDRTRDTEAGATATELRELWRRYKVEGDERARERLVVDYSPLVEAIAGRIASGLPAHVEESDLVSYGLIGLMAAIERFDPGREVRFEAFAAPRVKGAIIDELRSLDWVPRTVRSRGREIERAHAALASGLGRTPTDEEMAERLEIPVEGFRELLREVARSPLLALDDPGTLPAVTGDRASTLNATEDPGALDPHGAAQASELKDRLAGAIESLPEREHLVVALHYYENLTMREIGELLGVSESRISQLHTKAVADLRSAFRPQ
jgi:RNA polymerase sigma factor FliA